MTTLEPGLVERWFGPAFARLHPLIMAVHRHDTTLCGVVDLHYGSGFAGWIGRRLAARLGLPKDAGPIPMRVDIHADDDTLHWRRRFGNGRMMNSEFRPIGHWPDGHWLERTGAITLLLAVDVTNGNWSWRPVGHRFCGLPLPAWIMPRVIAGKSIEHDRYRFEVQMSLPGLGLLVAYGGLLDVTFRDIG